MDSPMAAPPTFTSLSVPCQRPQEPHLPQPHPLPTSPYCIVKKSSTTPHSTRKEIHKREIKYPIPLRSSPLATDPPSSSQSGMGGLDAPFLVFPISVPPRNRKIAPVAFPSVNNSDSSCPCGASTPASCVWLSMARLFQSFTSRIL